MNIFQNAMIDLIISQIFQDPMDLLLVLKIRIIYLSMADIHYKQVDKVVNIL